jgi:hypothetical protein
MPWKNYNPSEKLSSVYSSLPSWGVDIATTDDFAYSQPENKSYKWVYNKINICETQNLACGPIGTEPTEYPVIIKPIINLWGGGNSIKIAHNKEQYDNIKTAGLFWSPFQLGEHYSVDVLVLDGQVVETIWFRGEKLQLGMFDYWELVHNYSSKLYCFIEDWVKHYLKDYTGCLNLEIIGDYIVEAHLRMGDIDRIGSLPLMEAIHILYNSKKWPNIDLQIPEHFYIAALFAQPTTAFTINKTLTDCLFEHLQYYQIDTQEQMHCNPPAGNRLAVFCDTSFDAVCKARNIAISLFTPHIDGKYTDCLTNFKDLRQ